jgi:mono/diheme cytochrome c family protein
VPNPGSATGTVPAFKSATLMMDVSGPEDIREYILHGYPRRKVDSTAWHQAQAAALKMPAYEDVLDAAQTDDLLAYYLSANDRVDLDGPARAGRALASRLGCFGCHGIDGSGGVPNPGSLKGYVPGWLGPDYSELVASPAELREWILDGSVGRLREHLAARQFLRRQKVQMPPYRSLLDAAQLDALVAYIEALRAAHVRH